MSDFLKLEKKLKTEFINKNLLKQALIHRSYINEHPSTELEHNERLEFLGDAVLELVVTENLYNNYPNPEGELTNWRAALVNAKMLAQVAHTLEIEKYLFLSKGESKDKNEKARNYILANAMEALIGAIYMDKGWDEAKKFIENHILNHLPNILENKLYIDAKSLFQEQSQEKVGITPSYQVISESGPDHNKTFVIGVYLEDELVAEGTGTSKQEAQMSAAENGLDTKKWR
ncbi:MAG: ribonuclease III [Patescibacteria group bacterium]